MKQFQFIYKAAIGLMLMTCVADTAHAQTIFRGLRSKKTSTNFKTPVVYSIAKADTSLNFDRSNFDQINRADQSRQKAKRDSVLSQKLAQKKTDSIANMLSSKNARRIDSIAGVLSSSNQRSLPPFRDSFTLRSDTRSDTMSNSVDAKLTAIQQELQNIKTVMRNQALVPHYRYMRYQLDSLNVLTTRLNKKASILPADRLQIRVYQLQQDSIRNEMQKLIWISQYPAKDYDSSARFLAGTPVYPYMYQLPYRINDHSSGSEVARDTTYNSVTITDTTWYSGIDSTVVILDSSAPATISNKPASGRLLRSEQARARNDSDSNYNARISALQKRLDSMERVANRSQTTQSQASDLRSVDSNSRPADTNSRPVPSDSLSVDANSNLQSVSAATRDSLSRVSTPPPGSPVNSVSQKTLDSFDLRLRNSSDSIAAMQSGLKAVRDSAAYYRRSMYAMDLDPSDTVVEKKKWYNRILPKGKKQKEEEADLALAKSYSSQESYFAQQSKNMSLDIERLQRDNQNLKNDYDRLRRTRDDRRDDRFIRQAPATLIQAGTSVAEQRELSALRREISEMRQQLTNTNSTNRDTVVMQLPQNMIPVAPSDRDSVQIISLQSDLASLRKELDSIRRLPPPKPVAEPVPNLAAAPTPAAAAYDVSSFPVISVYFAMNASTLPSTQTGKISPMVSVAQKNKNAKIVLSGFTDPVGNVKINTALAKKRIGFVRNLLVSKYKIPGDQIIIEEPEISATRGVKKANPLDRRVDLRFE